MYGSRVREPYDGAPWGAQNKKRATQAMVADCPEGPFKVFGEPKVLFKASESGSLKGPWKHLDNLLFEKDGGHGMLFKSKEEKLYFTFHQPNTPQLERPHFFEIEKNEEGYRLV